MKPIFPYIDSASDLPNPSDRETTLLDFKGRVDGDTDAECAKDISAFANASGGVLVVGAAEDTTRGHLGRWLPVTDQEAQKIVRRYENIARDICEPSPFIAAKPIAVAGGFVVVVNVRPEISGQVIGVRMTPNQKPMVDVWAFFQRVGTDNRDVRPEQLPMLMIPELRRVLLLIEAIPDPKNVVVVDANGNFVEGCINYVSQAQNIFVLTGNPSRTFPLDAVKTAYSLLSGNRWRILLDVPCI